MKCKWFSALLCLFCPLTVLAALTTVTPKALTGPLTNPGIGVASFHQGYGETLGLPDYPDTGFEYERFTGVTLSLSKASTILHWLMTLSSMPRRIDRR